jgi:hypothetical protein
MLILCCISHTTIRFATPEIDLYLQQVNINANEINKASIQKNAFIRNAPPPPSSCSYHLTVLIGTDVPYVAILDSNYAATFVILLQQFALTLLLAIVCH